MEKRILVMVVVLWFVGMEQLMLVGMVEVLAPELAVELVEMILVALALVLT